jgi:hypothetical protein
MELMLPRPGSDPKHCAAVFKGSIPSNALAISAKSRRRDRFPIGGLRKSPLSYFASPSIPPLALCGCYTKFFASTPS